MLDTYSTSRRRFLVGTAVAAAAVTAPSLVRGGTSEGEGGATAIRTFKVAVPDADILAMKHRIAGTRWADTQPAADDGQGVRRQTLHPLMEYWAGAYDWRAVEARLNALPMFETEIDGLDIHFIHVRSRHDTSIPARPARSLASSRCSSP